MLNKNLTELYKNNDLIPELKDELGLRDEDGHSSSNTSLTPELIRELKDELGLQYDRNEAVRMELYREINQLNNQKDLINGL